MQANENKKGFEEALLVSANQLREIVVLSGYKYIVLGLIFQKFVSDKFEKLMQDFIVEGKEKFIEIK